MSTETAWLLQHFKRCWFEYNCLRELFGVSGELGKPGRPQLGVLTPYTLGYQKSNDYSASSTEAVSADCSALQGARYQLGALRGHELTRSFLPTSLATPVRGSKIAKEGARAGIRASSVKLHILPADSTLPQLMTM